MIVFCFSDDEGGNIKPLGLSENRKGNQNDLYMRLGLLLGDGNRNKRQKHKSAARDSCTSLASLDAHTLASNNTSPVSPILFLSQNYVYFQGLWKLVEIILSIKLYKTSNNADPYNLKHEYFKCM